MELMHWGTINISCLLHILSDCYVMLLMGILKWN